MRVRRWPRLGGTSALLALAVTGRAGAQNILLQLRPHAGDTVHMRLDQQSKLTGTHGFGATQSTSSVVTDLQMFSRAIVQGATAAGTTILAITDSVAMSTNDVNGRALAEQTRRMLEGKQVMLRLAPDGTVEMLRDPATGASQELANVVSLMPAAFPRGLVHVGESWTREMPLPADRALDGRTAGRLRAVFRLDSVSRGGGEAYVSMRGEMHPDEPARSGAPGLIVQDGTVSGTMRLDRRRGWLAETRFVIVVRSAVMPAQSSGISPMHFQMTIIQRTRTLDKR